MRPDYSWSERKKAQARECRMCGEMVEPFYEANGLNLDGSLTVYYECEPCGRRFRDRLADPEALPPRPDGKVLVRS